MNVRLFSLALLGLLLLPATLLRAQTSWTPGRIGLPGVTGAYGVAYGNGRFVATLGGNAVNGANPPAAAWSTDGVTWNASSLTSPQQASVVFTAGAFYLAGNTTVMRSTDGQTWTTIYNSSDFNVSFRGIATDGRSMMIGSASSRGTAYVYSPDLINWRSMPALPSTGATGTTLFLNNPIYGIDRYFAFYSVQAAAPSFNLTSFGVTTRDGLSWNPISPLSGLLSTYIASGNGRILAISGFTSYLSLDGVTFTDSALSFDLANGGSLAFAGGRFFMLGTLVSSSDGLTWRSLATAGFASNTQIRAIAYGKGRYVAVGYNTGTPFTDFTAYLNASAPPLITSSPAARTSVESTANAFTVVIENPDLTTTFQWKRDGVAIVGAALPTFTLARASLADAGIYTCTVTNTLGSVTSDAALLTVIPAAQAGRIINLSVLTSLDAPDTDFTLGFVIGGAGTSGAKSLLVRAAGPSLAPFGITNFLPDPKLQFFAGGTLAGENNDWLGTPALAALIAQTGAFPYTSTNSKDAAFAPVNLTTASNTVIVASATAGTGTGSVIAEVYDATPASSVTATTPRLINVSVLKNIPAGGTLTAGFVIGGLTAKTVLIRATGPALAPLGVTNTLSDPKLTFYKIGTAAAIATNDNWGGTQALKDAFAATGAFGLDPAGKDAALLLTLQPGSYTAEASGVGPSGGTALVEIYEVL